MSSKKNKRNDRGITARLTEQLENESENRPDPAAGVPAPIQEKPAPIQEDPAPAAETPAPPAAQSIEDGSEETLELIRTFRSSIDGAFSGYEETAPDVEEEEEETAEPETAEEAPAASRPNKFYLAFAVFIIIMSIIGMISTVRFITDKIEDIANQTALKNELALFVYPVVTVDPPEFSNASEIPRNIVIESAIWKIILTGDTSNYEKVYSTYMYVPAVDVEFAARSLYGSEANIVHQSVGNVGSAFTYNENMNSYLVPISPRYTYYSPSIRSIANVGELYTVRVEYIPPSALAVEGINFQNTTNKIMEFTISRSKNNMTVRSVRNTASLGDVHAY